MRKDELGNKNEKAQKQIEIINLLIDHKAEVNIQDIYNATPLHYLASEADSQVLIFLIDHGAKFDLITKNGQTPLHFASRSGNYQVVELLINKGADINVKDLKGNTPLMLAQNSKKNNDDVVRILLEHGAK